MKVETIPSEKDKAVQRNERIINVFHRKRAVGVLVRDHLPNNILIKLRLGSEPTISSPGSAILLPSSYCKSWIASKPNTTLASISIEFSTSNPAFTIRLLRILRKISTGNPIESSTGRWRKTPAIESSRPSGRLRTRIPVWKGDWLLPFRFLTRAPLPCRRRRVATGFPGLFQLGTSGNWLFWWGCNGSGPACLRCRDWRFVGCLLFWVLLNLNYLWILLDARPQELIGEWPVLW